MYAAIYAPGLRTTTAAERQRALLGYIYSPFRARDFFESLGIKADGSLRFSVQDAESSGDSPIIYEHGPDGARSKSGPTAARPRFKRDVRIQFGGREWLVSIVSLPAFALNSAHYLPIFAFFGGLLLSFLVYGLLTVAKRRASAERSLLLQEQTARLSAEDAREQLANGEESLRRSMQNLRQALHARDEFLSIASHELKTPLTSLKLESQIISRHFAQGKASALTPERMRDWAESADRQVDKLVRLVDDMLDVSRIATGRLSVKRENLDLSRLVRETIDKFTAQAEAASTTIRADIPEGVFTKADPLRLEQVVTNLLSNAVKYGDGKSIELKLRKTDGDACISVTDHGIGIEPENQERIFQRFERAVPTDSISGLGLGLFISKQIVSAHGGQITVNSKTGEGSTFTVLIPASAANEPEPNKKPRA